MMTLDASPVPAYAIYESADYQNAGNRGGTTVFTGDGRRFRSIGQSDFLSALSTTAKLHPAILVHVANSANQVNLSSDTAAVDADHKNHVDEETKPRTHFNRKRALRTSVATWQWISELVAAAAFLVTVCTMATPGTGRGDK